MWGSHCSRKLTILIFRRTDDVVWRIENLAVLIFCLFYLLYFKGVDDILGSLCGVGDHDESKFYL